MSDEKEVFKLPGKAEIEKLKKEHGEIFQVDVKEKDGTVRSAILRKPKMRDLQVATASEKKKPMSFAQSIWSNCKLVGDPAIEASDYLIAGAYAQLDEIVEFAEASVKKL